MARVAPPDTEGTGVVALAAAIVAQARKDLMLTVDNDIGCFDGEPEDTPWWERHSARACAVNFLVMLSKRMEDDMKDGDPLDMEHVTEIIFGIV